ncbi:MAG TPA: aminoglycoside phosphotransferase family protein [Acidimicrobiales bacterium]|nr:aminoglycoside phosphotransferase family protein [Acidimicrobiales bacterium]
MARLGPVIRDVYRRPGVDALPGHLEQQYGIHVLATTRLDAGVVKVSHDSGPPWVARLFVAGRTLGRAEQDAEVLRFLERQGMVAERVANEEPVSSLDGRAVLVTEFVEGRKLPDTAGARRKAGDLLGRTHVLPTEPGPTERPAGSLHHLPDYEGYAALDLEAAAALLADLDGRVPPEHRSTYDALLGLLPKGDGGEGLPESFVHPDPAPSNLIVSPGDFVLVDWTGAGRGPRLASLAVLLTSVGPGNVADVLAGYRTHVKLEEEEIDRVAGALWVRPIWLACWRCWLACVSSKVDKAFVPDEGRIKALAAATRASLEQE